MLSVLFHYSPLYSPETGSLIDPETKMEAASSGNPPVSTTHSSGVSSLHLGVPSFLHECQTQVFILVR